MWAGGRMMTRSRMGLVQNRIKLICSSKVHRMMRALAKFTWRNFWIFMGRGTEFYNCTWISIFEHQNHWMILFSGVKMGCDGDPEWLNGWRRPPATWMWCRWPGFTSNLRCFPVCLPHLPVYLHCSHLIKVKKRCDGHQAYMWPNWSTNTVCMAKGPCYLTEQNYILFDIW